MGTPAIALAQLTSGNGFMAGRRTAKQADGQGVLFEEDFLIRILGDLVRNPVTALGELVANGWDAGASKVEVTIPTKIGGTLRVKDDGCGLTHQQFYDRWMKLGYNRQKHQGSNAEFPAGREGRRRAYGRNGQGRHGLLCFGGHYSVVTRRDGEECRFKVQTVSGKEPFIAHLEEKTRSKSHGTQVSVAVERYLPDPSHIREALASKFLHDPNFEIVVNGSSIPLTELPGLEQVTIAVERSDGGPVRLEVFVLQAEAGRAKRQSGVAFWGGGRLVGEPSWSVLGIPILDGRTRPGRRTTVIVRTDDLYDEILPDWTGFRPSELMTAVRDELVPAIEGLLRSVFADRVRETAAEAVSAHASALEQLDTDAAREIVEAVESIAAKDPLVAPKVLEAAANGMIEAKRKASLQTLIQRLSGLPLEDIEGIHRLLDEWTVRDALTVLGEISRRIKVVELLEKLMGEKSVDELRILHPLVTQARWLFGPEYDSPHYTFNVGLRKVMAQLLGLDVSDDAFDNPRNRPDLVIRPESTTSIVAAEDFDLQTDISTLRRVLIVELKKGGFTIGRKEMEQANGYVEDLLHSGHLAGGAFVHAFVVGHSLDPRTTADRTLNADAGTGRVQAMTFSQMTATANRRLFRIRDHVQERYPQTGNELVDELLKRPAEATQLGLDLHPTDTRTDADPDSGRE